MSLKKFGADLSISVDQLPCPLCFKNKRRYSNRQLSQHIEMSHSALELFACTTCVRAFSSKKRFQTHRCMKSQSTTNKEQRRKSTTVQEFHYIVQFLICTDCGLQVNTSGLLQAVHINPKAAIFTPQTLNILMHQFVDILLVHSCERFILCNVFVRGECPPDSFRLVFVSSDPKFQKVSPEACFSLYIIEAVKQAENLNIQNQNESKRNTGESGSTDGLLQDIGQGKKSVEEFFAHSILQNGDNHFTCNICTQPMRVNARPSELAQHFRETHLGMIGGGGVRLFNAQTQFRLIDLGEGNKQYECKICGHLTKVNVKSNALSQHFNDKHPEVRQLAALSFFKTQSEKLGQKQPAKSPMNTGANTSKHQLEKSSHLLGKVISRRPQIILDYTNDELTKEAVSSDIDVMVGEQTQLAQFECVLHAPVLPQPSILQSHEHRLLSDDVFQCLSCPTITVGIKVACDHFNLLHYPFCREHFDPYSPKQILQLFSFSDHPSSGVFCTLCNTSHCSPVSLQWHLLFEHNVHSNLESNPVDIFELAAKLKCTQPGPSSSSKSLSSTNYEVTINQSTTGTVVDADNDDTIIEVKPDRASLSSLQQLSKRERVDDDIVFGGFIRNPNFDEFDRLLRSQNTVLPYFEIVTKVSQNVLNDLINSLVHLAGAEKDNSACFKQIVSFTAELWKVMCRNGVRPMRLLAELIKKHPLKEGHIDGAFAILEELFEKSSPEK